MQVLKAYALLIGGMSIVGFVLMAIDKQLSKTALRRISEKNLLLAAALGGAAGSWLAMVLFRHKTRHRAFSVGLPIFTMLHLAILIGLLFLISKGGLE